MDATTGASAAVLNRGQQNIMILLMLFTNGEDKAKQAWQAFRILHIEHSGSLHKPAIIVIKYCEI